MRNRVVRSRLTEKEYQELLIKVERSSKNTISAYLREMILKGTEETVISTRYQEELVRQVRKIGVNINQITARHNSGLYFASDRRKLMEEMKKLIELVEKYQDKTEGGGI